MFSTQQMINFNAAADFETASPRKLFCSELLRDQGSDPKVKKPQMFSVFLTLLSFV